MPSPAAPRRFNVRAVCDVVDRVVAISGDRLGPLNSGPMVPGNATCSNVLACVGESREFMLPPGCLLHMPTI